VKILTISDTVFHSSQLKDYINKDIDLIITLGDLKESFLIDLQKFSCPKIGIYGNHCNSNYLEDDFFEIKNIHLTHIKIKDLLIYGFEGCVKYKGGNYQYSQEECLSLFSPSLNVNTLICHAPPFGVNDSLSSESHKGFIAIRDFIDKYRPKYVFHGHSYPSINQKISKINNTVVFYCNGIELWDLNKLPEIIPNGVSYK